MKKLHIVLLFALLFGSVNFAYATSGACSSHDGVNMSAGADYDGSVICNDGWRDSTVKYADMKDAPTCTATLEDKEKAQQGMSKMLVQNDDAYTVYTNARKGIEAGDFKYSSVEQEMLNQITSSFGQTSAQSTINAAREKRMQAAYRAQGYGSGGTSTSAQEVRNIQAEKNLAIAKFKESVKDDRIKALKQAYDIYVDKQKDALELYTEVLNCETYVKPVEVKPQPKAVAKETPKEIIKTEESAIAPVQTLALETTQTPELPIKQSVFRKFWTWIKFW